MNTNSAAVDGGGAMELVLIRGLPGSGKTTMARNMVSFGYEHYEADQYFERDGEFRFSAAQLHDAHAWCLERVRDCLERGVRCVVANTFTMRWEIQPYIDAASEFGVSVRVIEACGPWESIHGVPEDTMKRMRARWEPLDIVNTNSAASGEGGDE